MKHCLTVTHFLAAVLLMACVSGCHFAVHDQQICHHCGRPPVAGHSSNCHCPLCKNHDLGLVQTGGQFARAQTLAIPSNGLTLAAAVDATLRDAVRKSSFQAVTTTRWPLSEQPSTVFTPTDEANGILRDFQEDRFGTDELRLNKARELLTVYAKVNDGVDPASSRLAEQIAAVFKEAYERVASNEDLPEEEAVSQATIQNDARRKVETLVSTQVRSQSKTPPQSEVGIDNTYYQIAVQLSRGNQHLVFPLWLVDGFQAGDIALRNGDSIDLVHYNRTGLFDQASDDLEPMSDVSAAITANASDLDGYIDLLRVVRQSRSGKRLQFFIPRNVNLTYGSNPNFDSILKNAYGDPDTVQAENLDLVDVIRQGRAETVRLSAEGILGKEMHQQLDESQQQLREQLAQLPVVGQLCSLLESTTGFNSSSATRSIRSGVGNLIGLLP